MFAGIFVLVVTGVIAFVWINATTIVGSTDNRVLKQLFVFHALLYFAYYAYTLFNNSDSVNYFYVAGMPREWMSLYGTSTTFVTFLTFPWVNTLGFNYEATMAIFSFFGYLGFFFFYIAIRERIYFRHEFLGVDLLKLVFFLPNLHFWSASIGKGSVILFGIGLFFYGISRLNTRWWAVILGTVIMYHVRPHIMLVMIVSYGLAFIFSTRGVSAVWRLLFLAVSCVAFFYIYKDVLSLVGIDEDALLAQGLDLTRRAGELSKATSGVDISNYSLPMQVFTFLYRPLFFDAPGLLGLIVSFENALYLLLTLQLLTRFSGWKFLFTSDFMARGALLSFITITIALAQIAGNLGLAIRQKSQVMILLLFVILAYLDDVKKKNLAQVRSRTK